MYISTTLIDCVGAAESALNSHLLWAHVMFDVDKCYRGEIEAFLLELIFYERSNRLVCFLFISHFLGMF